MNKQDQTIASFTLNNEIVMEMSNDDKDKLIARTLDLLESAFQSATCSIKNIQTDTVVQTLQRTPVE